MGKIFLHDQTREALSLGNTGANLVVNCPSGTIVTATLGQTVRTITAGTTNTAVFQGLSHGVWKIVMTNGSQTVTKTVEIVTDYEVVIDFITATIIVEYPEGSECTCTDGVTTYTAPDTSGIWYCVVSGLGSWTVSCTNGEITKSKVVEISYADQYVETLISYFEATITATYPSGAYCSCTNGDIVYSASDESGVWTFTVYKPGDWTITASDGIQTVSSLVNVSYDGEEKTTVIKFFASVINIIYPEGAVCTCTDGITTFTAPNTSGSWSVTVPRIGTWTIEAVNNVSSVIETVKITRDGEIVDIVCEFFAAYINVMYPAGSFKVVLWYVDNYGTKNTVAVDNGGSGQYRFMVGQIGNYEIGVYRVVPYVGIESIAKDYTSTTATISTAGQVVSVALTYNTLPEFTYTGTYKIVDDSGNTITSSSDDWNIQFLTGGNLRFTKLNGASTGIDVFVLGGGGNGGDSNLQTVSAGFSYGSGGGGGGGGYRNTSFGVMIEQKNPYEITVGGAGGESSAFGVSASGGGNGGSASDANALDSGGEGGQGGSKGGDGGVNSAEGSDGEDGTYAFIGTSGYRYGAGGGGGYGYNGEIDMVGPVNYGGLDGGADSGEDAAANSGGGGGGENQETSVASIIPPGKGGSGIVIIRNKR